MLLFYLPIVLTIISNVLYHVFLKLMPENAAPMLVLGVTYATATVVCLLMLAFYPSQFTLRESLRQLNWISFALAFALVGMEFGFLLAYRSGWNISLGGLVSNVTVSSILLPVGLLFFRENLSTTNLLGILVCLVGLVMVNQS